MRASRHSSANKLKGCQRLGAAQVKYGCVIGGYQQVAYPQYDRIRIISLSGGPQAERLVRGWENSKFGRGLASGEGGFARGGDSRRRCGVLVSVTGRRAGARQLRAQPFGVWRALRYACL